MEKLKRNVWVLRKEIASNFTKASLSTLTGAVCVPLEVVAHISPLYWAYKVKTYTPGTRELETLDFFDDAKEYMSKVRKAKEQLKELKKRLQERVAEDNTQRRSIR